MYSRHIEAEIYYASEIVFVSFATRRHLARKKKFWHFCATAISGLFLDTELDAEKLLA